MPDAPHPYDDWADIYDRVYAYLDHDLDFYVAQAKAANGPVLELGCGTGRVTLAMAAAGANVTAVDISPRMIERATAKAKQAGLDANTRFIVEDMAQVEAGGGYALVCFPFRSFQSLLDVEDQRETLENVAAHLRPNGRLALDLYMPDFEQLGNYRDAVVPLHVRDVEQEDGGRIIIWGQNQWSALDQINLTRLIIEELDPNGTVTRRLYRDFDLRYTFRYELEHLLELTGFTIESVHGGFDGEDITDSTEDLVVIARKS